MKLEDNLKGVVTRIAQEFKTTNTNINKKADKTSVYTKTEVDQAIDSKIGSVYKPKGNVPTYADLPKTGNQIGDVYNVVSTGVNYAWVGGVEGELKDGWDSLGGVVDLSGYLTTAQGDAKYEPKFTKNAAFNKSFGTTAGSVAQGNDSRFHTHSNKSVLDGTTASFTIAQQTKLEGISEGANNYVHPTTAGNKHLPTAGSTGQFVKWSAAGTGSWNVIKDSDVESTEDLVALFNNAIE